MTLEDMERSANQLIERGDTDLAIKQIYELACMGEEKRFRKSRNLAGQDYRDQPHGFG